MDITVIILQMIKFLLLMSVGYGLFKCNIMDSDFNKKLTNFVLRVANPCMITASVFTIGDDRNISKVLSCFLIFTIIFIIMPVIGMIIAKIIRCKPENAGLYTFMMIFSNTGFIGFPVIESILGGEALFYAGIFNMIFNIFLFTVGVKAINHPSKSEKKMSALEIIMHPGVFSAVIAIVLYFTNIKLPGVVTGVVDQIGDLTPTLAMILMGASLAKVPIKKVFSETRAYAFIIFKQLIIPLLAWSILSRVIADRTILAVTLILLAMPIANSVVMFAIEYDRNEDIAAKNVFISTIASIVLFPLVYYLTYMRF